MRREKSCGAVVYRKRKKGIQILLICHKKGKHWSFPKGHVENNETEIETAVREIREETGLEVIIDERFREQISYKLPYGNIKDVVYFAAEENGGILKCQEEEVCAMGWFSPHNAMAKISHESSRKILRSFFDFIKI